MINLKNLKSLFILDDEETTPKQEKEKKVEEKTPKEKQRNVPLKPKNKQMPPPLPKTVQSSKKKIINTIKPSIDERHYKMLLQAMEDNNLDDFDYLEFKNSLKALEALPLDEATKYKSAFATASTMGLTFDNLVKTANYYKTIIDKEKDKFRAVLKQQVTQKILSKDQERQKLAQIVDHKQKQIALLEAEISEHNKELCDIDDYINDVSNKIEETKQNFVATYQHLQGKLDADIEKINKYLK